MPHSTAPPTLDVADDEKGAYVPKQMKRSRKKPAPAKPAAKLTRNEAIRRAMAKVEYYPSGIRKPFKRVTTNSP
jgi:hypothetical protein